MAVITTESAHTTMLGHLLYKVLAFGTRVTARRPQHSEIRALSVLALPAAKSEPAAVQAIVVFAATIGEINGIRPLANKLSGQFVEAQLVFITKKDVYETVVLHHFPSALVLETDTLSLSTVEWILRNLAVKALLIAEGPALLGRFSMHLPATLPLGCRAHRVPVFVVNACLFPRHFNGLAGTSSLLGRLYDFVFFSSFTDSVTYWYAPYPEVRDDLVRNGAPGERISVTGDIKFDVLPTDPLQTKSARLLILLNKLKAQNAPIIVAGSVTNFDDIAALISAWRSVESTMGRCVFVLAPRRIHDAPHMEAIYRKLGDSGVNYIKRSDLADDTDKIDFLVLDTFGELSSLYAASTVCFIARNHGVLEPLFFGRPVVVGPEHDWVAPSALPQYRFMVSKGAIYQLSDNDQMAAIFHRLLTQGSYKTELVDRAQAVLSEQQGALERVFLSIQSHLMKEE